MEKLTINKAWVYASEVKLVLLLIEKTSDITQFADAVTYTDVQVVNIPERR